MTFPGYLGTPKHCPFSHKEMSNFKLKKKKKIGLPKKFRTGTTFSEYPATPKHCPFSYKQVPNFKL